VRRTLPMEKKEEYVRADGQALARFLGFVEGRLRVPIPEMWEAAVHAAQGRSQESIVFDIPDKFFKVLPPSEDKWLKRDADNWVVRVDNETVKLPTDDGLGTQGLATVLMDSDRVYVALFITCPGPPSRLWALDRRTNKTIWSSKTLGNGR